MIDVNESVWPQPLLHLFPHDNGSGLLQNRQYLKRLAGQFQPQSPFAQFLRLKANFKRGKADYLAGADLCHCSATLSGKSLTGTDNR